MNSPKDARARAEASFSKKEQQAHEGKKARAEYDSEVIALRAKTARLRELRLAKGAEKTEGGAKPPR